MVFGTKNVDFNPIEIFKSNNKHDHLIYSNPNENDLKINSQLKKIAGDHFINPFELFCKLSNCMIKDHKGNLIQYDGFHLTNFGAIFFGKKLRKKLLNFLN